MSNVEQKPGYGQAKGYGYDFAVKTSGLVIPIERVQTVTVKTKPKKSDSPTTLVFDQDLALVESTYTDRISDFPKGLLVTASVGKSNLYGSEHKKDAILAALDSALSSLFKDFPVRVPVPDGVRVNDVLQKAPTWKRYVFTVPLVSSNDLPVSDIIENYTEVTSFEEGVALLSSSGIAPWEKLADLPQYLDDFKFSQIFPAEAGIAVVYTTSRKNPVFPAKERDALRLLFPDSHIEMSLIHENKIV